MNACLITNQIDLHPWSWLSEKYLIINKQMDISVNGSIVDTHNVKRLLWGDLFMNMRLNMMYRITGMHDRSNVHGLSNTYIADGVEYTVFIDIDIEL